ncbi:uncharacterized protein MONOS_9225 [Monocercomonoides exilis]|uniref:uncharacterized protein n=1 Tax=Monocercomonoides exilis TaxID=2049356 RepID=UPI00355A2441|nr:hypothetical protein MONOS_9225 [Monocercomonoides exilis]|eukprot:MONOS_9225.1-p1 / transcript=MONOS_9225.1 / gene=MONOS_9225 / organism=Monocercomonoides_exilis_PA203 / gene_product=unspecified product / transcript_product=unspecified product / location=Mono_scaffold00372:54988-55496(-) / protein_length=156 / sequence_SO=supercontig / SO=protein_coding / is_pseudo=false
MEKAEAKEEEEEQEQEEEEEQEQEQEQEQEEEKEEEQEEEIFGKLKEKDEDEYEHEKDNEDDDDEKQEYKGIGDRGISLHRSSDSVKYHTCTPAASSVTALIHCPTSSVSNADSFDVAASDTSEGLIGGADYEEGDDCSSSAAFLSSLLNRLNSE